MVALTNSVEKCSLQYHLSPDTEHTVYEAEITGLLLDLHLLSLLKSSPHSPVVIGSDSQATICALLNQKPHPAHHLLDQVHTSAEWLHATHYKLRHPSTPLSTKQLREEYTQDIINLQVHWTLGHVDFPPNERADEIAKSAASGMSSHPNLLPLLLCKKPLPHSILALRHTNLTQPHPKWKQWWKRSPRHRFASHIDNSLPSNTYLKLTNNLDCNQSALLTQLRTSYSPLNQHLFHICHSETPVCSHCWGITPETVTHYLLQCLHYQHECHILRRKLKRKADSLSFLLSDSAATLPLLTFIHSSKHFASAPPPTTWCISPSSPMSCPLLGPQLSSALLLTSFQLLRHTPLSCSTQTPCTIPQVPVTISTTHTSLHHQVLSTLGRNRGARSKTAWKGRLVSSTRNPYQQFHGWGGGFCGSCSH